MREKQLYEMWLQKDLEDSDLKTQLVEMKNNEEEIKESFYKTLEFGTGGLRGVMGAGTNRMNIYTVRQATQGFANYLKRQFANREKSVAIAYDSRNKSKRFAEETARVMAANGIKAYLYSELMPTPALSFAVRQLNCVGGVMVTASHNPGKYNGYKAYDEHGCQLTDIPASQVIEEVQKVDMFEGVLVADFKNALQNGTISYIDNTVTEDYYNTVIAQSVENNKEEVKKVKVAYTPLNGAGNKPVSEVLKRIGLENLEVVAEQQEPNGDFPTCSYPNPESPAAMKLVLELAEKTGADIALATDPDSDRAGLAALDNGEYRLFTGNEIGILLLDYIIESRIKNNTLPENGLVVKTIVSSKLIDKMCEKHNLELKDVLTGFKYIGQQILSLENKGQEEKFVFGYEESYGYLAGGYVRDKDAVEACMLLTQMAASYKAKGTNLQGRLNEIYEEYGFLLNRTQSFEFEGLSGMDKMAEIMGNLRQNPPREFAGQKVVTRKDYLQRICYDEKGDKTPIGLPKSNVLEFVFQSGSSLIIRPSGTEPKMKAYFSIEGKTKQDCEKDLQELSTYVAKIME